MKKEEILAASRRENRNQDLAELETARYAGNLAGKVGATVCCLLSLLSSLLTQTLLYSPWVIYFSIISTNWLVRAHRLGKTSDRVVGLLFAALTLLALIGLLGRLLEVKA